MLSATVFMFVAGWILEEAAKHKFIKGIVAGLDLTSPKVKLLITGDTVHIVSLSNTLYPLPSTGSTKEDLCGHD